MSESRAPVDRAVRVVCAVPYALGRAPGQRFRWEQWAPFFGDHGVTFEFVPFGTPELERARREGRGAQALILAAERWPNWFGQLFAARHADLVVVYRNAALAGPPIAELMLHRLGVPFVYDFDDAIHLTPEVGDDPVRRFLRADWRVPVLCRRATLVSVGNPTLAEFARSYNPRCEVWPTTILMESYRARPRRVTDDVPIVGWTGSPSTGIYLETILPVLREVQRTHRFRLLVVGTELDLRGVEGECIPWTAEDEVASLHRMDIGLMPLPDTPWTRCKCAAKALQYSGVGVPAIVSDVGVNGEAVLDGVTGFVVRTPEEWAARLRQMLSDGSLRTRMGVAAREHVAEHYSAEVWGPRIAARLRTLAQEAKAPRSPVARAG